ncbi:hypothetical protein [Streptomyces sparsus]
MTIAVPCVEVLDSTVGAVCTLRDVVRRKELVATDRQWRQSVRLPQASAFRKVATRPTRRPVGPPHLLGDSPTERPAVERDVHQFVNPAVIYAR